MVQPIETVELVKPLRGSWGGDATSRRGWLNALGVRALRFDPLLKDKELSLRLCGLWHLKDLKTRFHPGLFLLAAGRDVRPFRSLFAFLKWLKSTFDVFYRIEIRDRGERRVIGFVGFYSVRAEDHLWMSLAIFDANDRRRGYGVRAVELVCDYLRHETGIKQVFVEVAKRNLVSRSFFQACSFRQKGKPGSEPEPENRKGNAAKRNPVSDRFF